MSERSSNTTKIETPIFYFGRKELATSERSSNTTKIETDFPSLEPAITISQKEVLTQQRLKP